MKSRSRIVAVLVLALLAASAGGCTTKPKPVTYDPAKPSSIAAVIRAHEATICAFDSMADNFVQTSVENRTTLADAAGKLTPSTAQPPRYPSFPGYYLLVKPAGGGQDLYIGLLDPDTLVVRRMEMSTPGDLFTGAAGLWQAVAGLLSVSPEESGDIGVLFETDSVIVSGREMEETTIDDKGAIAQIPRLLREGQPSSALSEIARLPAPQLTLRFVRDDAFRDVSVWADLFVFDGQLYERPGIEQVLRAIF